MKGKHTLLVGGLDLGCVYRVWKDKASLEGTEVKFPASIALVIFLIFALILMGNGQTIFLYPHAEVFLAQPGHG